MSHMLREWARAYVESTSLEWKQRPPLAPPVGDTQYEAPEMRVAAPGRPPELTVVSKAPKTPKEGALVRDEARARLLHTFFHHELQAAELMCWAILAFPNVPPAFTRGLVGIFYDEVRHMDHYARRLSALGYAPGAFAVRDWFWERVPNCQSARSFVATMGMGLEGTNLDYAGHYADAFRAVGDVASASVQETVLAEEIPHVAFAVHWFRRLSNCEGPLDFDAWGAALPAPLSPWLLRGRPVNHEARRLAGMDPAFLERLANYEYEARARVPQ